MNWESYSVHQSLGCILREGERLLLEAVEQQDLAAVQQQLAARANPSAADLWGLSALHIAAAAGQSTMVQTLLAAGANVRAAFRPICSVQHVVLPLYYMVCPCTTPLYYMVCQAYKSGLRLDDERHITYPVHVCSPQCEQLADVAQQLVAAGDPASSHPSTLQFAAKAGCPALVAVLLQAGAHPAQEAVYGGWKYNALHAAASSGSRHVVEQLLSALGTRAAAVLQQEGGRLGGEFGMYASTPLHLAAFKGQQGVVEALVAAGADKEQQDCCECTALQVALRAGHHHLVPLLVTPGNVNQRYNPLLKTWDPDRSSHQPHIMHTPLHLAVACQEQGVDSSSHAPRHAVRAAAAKAVTALLAAGANASAKDRDGLTPLAAAAAAVHMNVEVLQVLLHHELQRLQKQARKQQQRQQRRGHNHHHRQQQQQEEEEEHAAVLQLDGMQVVRELLLGLATQLITQDSKANRQVIVSLFVQHQGAKGPHTLWRRLKQQLLPLVAPEAVGLEAGRAAAAKAEQVVAAWGEYWAAAAARLAAQRSTVTERLQQLVLRLHQHEHQAPGRQQQAGQATEQQQLPANKRPRLTRELRSLSVQPHVPPASAPTRSPASPAAAAEAEATARIAALEAAMAAGGGVLVQYLSSTLVRYQEFAYLPAHPSPATCDDTAAMHVDNDPMTRSPRSSNSTTTPGGNSSSSSCCKTAGSGGRRKPPASRVLEAAAAANNESGVRAALGQLPDRAAGLSAAAAAAGGAGHWGLCLQLLRELVMLDEGEGRAAVLAVHAAMPHSSQRLQRQGQRQRQQQRVRDAMQLCEALLEDWSITEQQQVRDVREAVVAAVAAAMGGAA